MAHKYSTPFIARLALDPIMSEERIKIEKWFQTLPEDVKPDIRGRLRDKSRPQHFGAYYELVLYQFFKSIGYSASIHPRLEEGEPDLLITGKNLDKPVIIEIATVFDTPDWIKAERKADLLLDQLNKIEHYFFVHVIFDSEHIPNKVDYRKLKRFVKQWMDSFDPDKTHDIQKTEYEEDELKLTLSLLPKLPFIIALNIANMPAGETGLINELFGKLVVVFKRTPDDEIVSTEERRDFSGLFTPKPGLEGKAQNTRLSATLIVRSKWLERGENEQAKRLNYFSVIYNPWACNPVDQQIFDDYPQFVTISEDDKGRTFDWINKDAEKPFYC